MTIDEYQTRLSLLTYKIYKKVKTKKMPYSVYYKIWSLVVEETRRATSIKLS